MKATIKGTCSKEELKEMAKNTKKATEQEVHVDDSDCDSSGGGGGGDSDRIDMDDNHAAHWNRDI